MRWRWIGMAWLVASAITGPTRAEELGQRLERTLTPALLRDAQVSAIVVDLADGRVVFERQADIPMVPASNQKLVVMGTAMDLLGRDFSFQTIIGLRGADLVVIGSGDPGFGDPKLLKAMGRDLQSLFQEWADALVANGVNRVEGDLVLDESIFDSTWTHPEWTDQDRRKWYAAPIGALNVNDNCLDVTVSPGNKIGGSAVWSTRPAVREIEMLNRAKTATTGVPVIGRRGDSEVFVLSGKCGKRSELMSVPVVDPGKFFADALKTALSREGIEITGGIRRERVLNSDGNVPADMRVVATWTTPLSDVLLRIGRDSQNLFAECLAKRMGYELAKRINSNHSAVSRKPAGTERPAATGRFAGTGRSAVTGGPVGSWASAGVAVKNYMRRAGIDVAGFVFSDGSGLSRKNRATARQLAEVLMHIHGHADGHMAISRLAVSGESGTLRRRMRDLKGQILAKTGTMRGIKSLSGYVLVGVDGLAGGNGMAGGDGPAGGSRRYAFSIIVNGIQGPNGPINRAQDAFCRELVLEAGRTPAGMAAP